MSKDNKTARHQLESKYGKGCMFKRANIEGQIERIGTIKTYKRFLQETRYTGKKIRTLERNMTYHHLRHKSEGGKATEENGANINELAHRYIHSLPRDQEEVINNMLRQFKLNITGGMLQITDNGIEMSDPFGIELEIDLSKEEDLLVIPLEDNTIEDEKRRQKFNRAKEKQKFKRMLDEELDYDDDYYR